jgi:hypothetical protein
VLYASFFFAIITAANYLLRNNLEAIGIFIIIGFLTTYFSKNMIVVLLTTTILTNFLVMFRNRGFSSIMMMEGFTAKEIPDLKAVMEAAKTAMDSATDDAKKAELKTKYEEAKKTYDDAVAAVAAAAIEDATASKSTETKPPAAPVTSSETFAMGAVPANTMKQPLMGGKGSSLKDGMSQLSPAPVGGESINPMMQAAASGSNAQKEQALSVLSNMGGSGDMVAQQNEMINNLKSIEPILNTAQSFLDKFENSSISKMFSGSGGFPGMSLLTGGAGGSKTSPAPVGS